ncbi:hypothetical protein ACFZAM_31910 [Streptomyces sp. NPDC008079]|uniref:hypothetical protein n=1 Tax=Streptomyces sp. NPDC008079 TaxID=3364806 RepID=UPI0036ECE7C2
MPKPFGLDVSVLIPQGFITRFPDDDTELHDRLNLAHPNYGTPRHLLRQADTVRLVRLAQADAVRLLGAARTLGMQWHQGGDPDGVRHAMKTIAALGAALAALRVLTPRNAA